MERKHDPLWYSIVKRRSRLSCGKEWPVSKWDYTEWDEALSEYSQRSKKGD